MRTVSVAAVEAVTAAGDMKRLGVVKRQRPVDREPDMHSGDVVGRAIDLQPNEAREHDGVKDVVVVPVDLDGGGRGLGALVLEIVVEVCLAQPAAVHHDLVPIVDLQAVAREVEEVAPAGAQRKWQTQWQQWELMDANLATAELDGNCSMRDLVTRARP